MGGRDWINVAQGRDTRRVIASMVNSLRDLHNVRVD